MPSNPAIDSNALTNLMDQFSGVILCPGEPGYDDTRRVHNGMIDRRPAVIARCLNEADVAEAIAFGVAQGLEIAVRGGGHNVAGRSVCDDGLMIDLSLMKGIWVDPTERRVRAQAGVCWAEFNRATQRHSLATTGGAVGSTGIAGLTLGGGFGYLMGKYGYTIDNLVSVDLVTSDGQSLRASATENTELFWGLRGGGGNFGVATSFEYALHPLGTTVMGGLIAFDFDQRQAVLQFVHQSAQQPDDDLTIACSMTHAPGGSGQKLAALLVCHSGDRARAEQVLGRVRQIAPPVIDRLGPLPYTELNQILDPSFPKLALNYWKSRFVPAMSDDVIDVLCDQFAMCPSPMSKLIIERPHGAALRPDPSATAFPHRTPGHSILILGQWADHSLTEPAIAWVRQTFDRLGPFSMPGAYGNYLSDDEYLTRVDEALGSNFQRLQALKDRYDPQNIFHLNQNIPPNRR